MHSDPAWAFIDESGDAGLQTERGASRLYSVAAVVAGESELSGLRERLDRVRAANFGRSVLKSKGVGGNLKRRVKVLEGLADAGVRFAALITDKTRIERDSSGLRFHRSFVKFVQGFLYARLFRASPAIRICADAFGTAEFQASFKDYMLRRHKQVTMLLADQPQLFHCDDKQEVLIQAADFLAGSVVHAFKSSEAQSLEILKALQPMSLGIRAWPQPRGWRGFVDEAPTDSAHDDAVTAASVESATLFLENAASEDDSKVLMQIEVVQELLLRFYSEGSPFASANELADMLAARGFGEQSRDVIRRDVTAPLRDRGVLIVSNEKGYALARGLEDMQVYLTRMQDEIVPILGRVGRMRDALRDRTSGRLDLFEAKRFAALRRLVECEEMAALQAQAADAAAVRA